MYIILDSSPTGQAFFDRNTLLYYIIIIILLLYDIICKFFMTAKRIDKSSNKNLGELYQPAGSLSFFLHCWQSSRGSKIDLTRDKESVKAREVLAAKRNILTKQGLGNKPCATRPLVRVGGVTIPGIKLDNNCFICLYGKTKPSFAAHSPPLRAGLHFANSGFIFPIKTDKTVIIPLMWDSD